MSYTIHTIESADYQAAAELLKAAFASSKKTINFDDQLATLRLERTYLPTFELVSKDAHDNIVGYGTISDAYIQGQPTAKLAILNPLGVLPDFQKQGVGRQLVDELEHRAFVRGYQAVLTTDCPDYFALFGYDLADHFAIHDAQTPVRKLSLRELRPGALRHTAGLLMYSPALNHKTIDNKNINTVE
ncbi:GNAT family N-acetyltransferase [Furfurilactobacillus milii]|uniref:GNAT family N-acetyltransferase n=1 Tax=Furfurilactobacillus milii TaxID=2888272 RepID=A0A6N9I545_9LACO|nr:N-acetyltransferase [Furfurilactobacillus milii]MYV18252.1 GNAT family N-acetyltransferase [Furfurilactobacillus milii]